MKPQGNYMLNLSKIVFETETKALDIAITKVGELAGSLVQLDKEVVATAARQAKVDKDAARAAELRSKTDLNKIKTDRDALKLERERTAATEATGEAIVKASKKQEAFISSIEKKRDLISQGWTVGESSVLKMADSLGIAGDKLQYLQGLLKDIGGLVSNPFDSAIGSLRSVNKELDGLKLRADLVNQGIELSSKQLKEYSKLGNEVAVALKRIGVDPTQGAGLKQYNALLKDSQNNYLRAALEADKYRSAEKELSRQHKETAAAVRFLSNEEERMKTVLETMNVTQVGTVSANERSAQAVAKYALALKRAGIQGQDYINQLETYKRKIQEVQRVEEKQRIDRLSRSLTPQISDVAVSLYGGMNPMQVLMQQGLQVRDLIANASVDADKLGAAFRRSGAEFAGSIAMAAKAVGSLLVGSLQAASKSVLDFGTRVTGLDLVWKKAATSMSAFGVSTEATTAAMARLKAVMTVVLSSGILLLITAFTALAVAMYKTWEANSELNKQLALTGGKFAITTKEAVAYATSLNIAGVTTLDATRAITEMSKAGNIAAKDIAGITKAAVEMERYVGVAVTDTIKKFSELQDKPSEVLLDIAKSQGFINIETLKLVTSLEKAGLKTEAATQATKAYQESLDKVVSNAKENLSPLEKAWDTIKTGVNNVFDAVVKLANKSSILDPLVFVFKSLASIIYSAVTAVNMLVESMIGTVKVLTKVSSFNFSGAKEDFADMGTSLRGLKTESDNFLENLWKVEKASSASSAAERELDKQRARDFESTEALKQKGYSKEKKALEEIRKLKGEIVARKLTTTPDIYDREYIAAREAEIDRLNKEIADAKKKTPEAKAANKAQEYFNNLMQQFTVKTIEADAATEKLTVSQKKLVDLANDKQFLALPRQMQDQVMQAGALAATTEIQAGNEERRNKAIELYNSLLGKSSGLGKEYYKQLELINENEKEGFYNAEQAREARAKLFEGTKQWKDHEKEVEDATNAYKKFKEEILKTREALDIENSNLDMRESLLGKTLEDQKLIRREQELQVKLAKEQNEYLRKQREIQTDPKLKGDDRRVQELLNDLDINYAEKLKTINREVVLQFAEDFDAAIRNIKNGITDALVTALFEGGKAGRKKLRDVIVAELRKKITLQIDAVVNAVVNAALSGLSGLLGGGGAGTTGGGGLLGGLSNLLGLGKGLTSLYSGLTSGTGFLGGIGSALGINQGAGAVAAYNAGGMSANAFASAAAGGSGGGFMSTLGSAMPWIGLGIGLLAAFGAFRKKKVVGSGIMGELGGDEALRDYTLTRKGGYIFGGPDYSIQDLGASEQGKIVQDTYKAMRQNTVDMAKSLGLDTSKIENYRTGLGTQIHPDTGARTGIDLKDLTPEEAQAKIAEALATANNEMAQQILGTWTTTTEEVTRTISERRWDNITGDYIEFTETVTDTIENSTYAASEYAKEGETAIETLTRLANSLGTVNAVFDSLGYTLYQGSLSGADLASQLIDAFGSIETFTNSTSAYYNAYYSEEEKRANLIRSVTEQLGKHNLALPKNKEEYRKLVEAQDLSTEEGRKMYAFLIQLAPVFAEIADSAVAVSDAFKSSLENAYSVLEQAVNSQKELLQDQLNTQQGIVDNLRSIFELLGSNVRELYGEVTSTSSMLAVQGRGVISNALSTGVLPDIKTLTEAITAVKNEVKTNTYATKFESDKAKLLLAADLLELQDQTEEQLTNEELILKGIKDQIQYLDDLLANAKEQMNAALGIKDAILSVAEALAAFQAALVPPATGNTRPTTADVANPSFGMVGDQGSSNNSSGVDYGNMSDTDKYLLQYAQALQWGTDDKGNTTLLYGYMNSHGYNQEDIARVLGFTPEEIAAHFANYGIPAFASGGLHSGGLRLVGENGPELEATGPARIYTASQTKQMMSSNSNDSELSAKLDRLSIETQAVAINTNKLVKLIERVIVPSSAGDAVQTSAV